MYRHFYFLQNTDEAGAAIIIAVVAIIIIIQIKKPGFEEFR